MSIYESLRAVADASGEGSIDWSAVGTAAKGAAAAGDLDVSTAERDGFAADVRAARDRVRTVSGLGFDVPRTVEIQNRHHWIDANVATFRRVMAPLEERPVVLPGLTRRVNTATMATMLSFLANNVLGQYDPLLLAERDPADHGLYFVRPNIRRVARALEVEYDRFRRWIAFHEVTHAAEFGAAPWLAGHLEERMQAAMDALAEGRLDRDGLRELDTAMTAVEGYAEFVMDRAFDDAYADLRAKVEARRRNRGPIASLVRRLLGLGMKRRQYERGKAFFDAVAEARGDDAAAAVWTGPDALPREDELEAPRRWLRRVDP